MVLSDIQLIKSDVQQWLSESAEIWTKGETRDEYGTASTGWAKASDNVPCRVIQERDRQGLDQLNGANVRVERYRVVFAAGTELPNPAQIRVNGVTLEVDYTQDIWTDQITVNAEAFRV